MLFWQHIGAKLLLVCLLCWVGPTQAQSQMPELQPDFTEKPSYWVVRHIVFEGNRKTKDEILLRELALMPGDTLPITHCEEYLNAEKNKLFNTDLFVTVEAWVQPDTLAPPWVDICYRFRERWYIFPVFIFELADRNLNEWLYDRGADLRRTNYGVRYVQKNLRGRNERLELLAQGGFTQKYELGYVFPYIDFRQRYGLEVRTQFMQNRDIAYTAEGNKLLFYSSESVIRERWNAMLRLRRREGFYLFHFLTLRYRREWVADSVLQLNPYYLADADSRLQAYTELDYTLAYDRRDIAVYPLRGGRWSVCVTRYGIPAQAGIDAWSLRGSWERFGELASRWFVDLSFSVRFFQAERQPYSLARGLGYGEELPRGFQRYVIDGQHFFLAKSTLKYELFNISRYLRFLPLEEFRTLPLAAYMRVFFDHGYVHDRLLFYLDNQLANRYLYAGGVGVDLVTFYNLVLQAEVARNSIGQTGFYFNIRGSF